LHDIFIVPTSRAQKHTDMQTFQVFKTWKV